MFTPASAVEEYRFGSDSPVALGSAGGVFEASIRAAKLEQATEHMTMDGTHVGTPPTPEAMSTKDIIC